MIQLIVGAMIISFSSVFVKLVDVGPTSAMFYRFLFGAIALFSVAVIFKNPLWRGWKPLVIAAITGFLFSLDLFLWHRSIHYIGPGVATLLANFQIFILTVIGICFLGERLHILFVVSIMLAFWGLYLILGFDWKAMDPLFQRGIVYGFITAFCYSGITLIIQASQKRPDKLSPMSNMAWVCFFGALFGSVETLASGESFVIPNSRNLFFLIAYGVVCSSLGWFLITSGLPHVSASMAGLALVLQPALAFVWDILFFEKPTTLANLVGAAMVVAAIYLGSISRRKDSS